MKRATKFAFLGLTFISLFLTNVRTTFALPISPDKYYLDVSTGQEITQTLTIMARPELPGETTYYLAVVGMKKVGELHDREFYVPDPNDLSEPANWITLSQTKIVVSPANDYKVNWTLKPSEYAGCGTNIAAIMVSDAPIEEQNTEGTEARLYKNVASQLHLNIVSTPSGDCTDLKANLKLLDFKVNKKIPVFNYDKVPFLTRIENSGTTISRSPEGFIEIFGLGNKITIPFNDDQLDIYPDTVRRFDDIWIDPEYPSDGTFLEQFVYELLHFRIGRYEARLGVTKNAEPSIVSTAHFWIIPWKVIIVFGAIIAIFVGYRISKSKGKTKKSSK